MKITAHLRPWAALTLPAVAWFVFQQGLSMTLRGRCGAAGIPLGPLWGVLSLTVCGAAARLAWSRLSGGTASDRFLPRLALLGAGLFALAIAFQTLATLIVPPCAR
ncbi:MAG: hypothetical protein JWN66_562 [Sphingomonas bacterium]|uniref:hypothetical protein n=1 Tax=Sphingomonas bacterium TaxID=1895847 RepID=UPI0026155621|nr:hypothetical protein [Sphingomonas bacterium]MDB5703446.1 hypothetical protein [Sphingomonas bacterium]